MNVIQLLALAGKLLPLVQGWFWVVPALFLVLREQHIRRHLPQAVSRWLNDPTLLQVVKLIARREDLDNEAKRAAAVTRIESYLKEHGIELPGHMVNLLLELIVARLHKEGVL